MSAAHITQYKLVMTLPCERTWAVVETRRFLTALLTNRRAPVAVREQARTLLRHYPSASDVFHAGWQALADPRLVLEPVFDADILDCNPSFNWPTPRTRRVMK
ncbi:BPSL0761 family protein [Rhodanobacter sp. Soil772]|uniref:BPSL0761 family protein n=1 Tax=Rhodanobacter sp. Soil772 TaxID=1736406 RepID=UPI002E12EE42